MDGKSPASLAVMAAVAFLTAAPAAAAGGGWFLSAGIYDTAGRDQPLELGAEYRFGGLDLGPLGFRPLAGVSATTDGNFWGYGGFTLELELGERWTVSPILGVSLYEDGSGKDLGGPLEFRSGLEIGFRFRGGSRLGVFFYHLSNADIYDENPGSNSLVLTWSPGP